MASQENASALRGDLWEVKKGADRLPHFAEIEIKVGEVWTRVKSKRSGNSIASMLTGVEAAVRLTFVQCTEIELREFLQTIGAAAPRKAPTVGTTAALFALTLHDPAAGNNADGDLYFPAASYAGVEVVQVDGVKSLRVEIHCHHDDTLGSWMRLGPAN